MDGLSTIERSPNVDKTVMHGEAFFLKDINWWGCIGSDRIFLVYSKVVRGRLAGLHEPDLYLSGQSSPFLQLFSVI